MNLDWVTDREYIFWVALIQTAILIIATYILLQLGFNIRIYHIYVNSTTDIPRAAANLAAGAT